MDKSQWQISDRFIVMLSLAFGIPTLAGLLLLKMANGGPRSAPRAKFRLQLLVLKNAINDYQTTFTNYPVGSNREVTKFLIGDNPRKLNLLRVNPNDLNSAEECLDPWKVPFAVLFSSTNSFVISSAGPNKIFGDADDIIFNSLSNDFVKP